MVEYLCKNLGVEEGETAYTQRGLLAETAVPVHLLDNVMLNPLARYRQNYMITRAILPWITISIFLTHDKWQHLEAHKLF